MLTAPNVILALKIAVILVTLIWLAAVTAIALGHRRLHGWLNTAFFVLTLSAVLGLEIIIRVLNPGLTDSFPEATRRQLRIHLLFSVPAAVLMILMFVSGWLRWKRLHLPLAVFFTIAWVGTFITGVFYLPHTPLRELWP